MNEGGKVTAEALFGFAIIMMIAAVYIYITRESNSYEKLASGVESNNRVTEGFEKQAKTLRELVDKVVEGRARDQELMDKFTSRMQMLEMRLDSQSKQSHNTAPQRVEVIMKHPIQLETPMPIKVIYKEGKTAAPPKLPVGKPLSKKSP